MEIGTGIKELDNYFKYKKEITLIYGPAATGKTTLAMLAAIEQARNKKRVLFIDTENGFSVERFKQLCKESYEEVLARIFLIKVDNFEDQCKRIDSLMSFIDMFDLIIIDTIGSYYRICLKDDPHNANKSLDKQLKILAEISRKGKPVIITNQVYTNIDKNEINVVGGEMLKNWSKCLIELNKKPRKILIKKPEEKEILFEIVGDGIRVK